ncbi:MAG TPA: MATE family efflux transporter [Clostridiales bacterium]|nr:MATE family efflux transporter [Clostridiales bacterium]
MKKPKLGQENSLGTASINKLLLDYTVPCIIGMVVSAAYNIVDQLFIGQSIGMLGNAATNVAFPLAIICTAISLLFGIGGAANFNLSMGGGEQEKARLYAGNAIFLMVTVSVVLSILTLVFLKPLMVLFGATDEVLSYAMTYTGVSAIGFPFLILSVAGGHLIRADGSPGYAMACNIIGAVINAILNPIFLFGLKTGIEGAAYATVIAQIIAGSMVIFYLTHFKTVKLNWKALKPIPGYCLRVVTLGMAPFFNQLAMMVVQVVLNNSLTYYGAHSLFGSEIPLACAGIITKVNMLFFAVVIGMSQGLQPIVSFNYGAGKYLRVKEAYWKMAVAATVISFVSFVVFQIFPKEIIALFGEGDKEYFLFAERFFRIFLFCVFIDGIQPITANFFTAIGRPGKGVFLSLTRQVIFLLPLLLLLPVFYGMDGIMYSAPIADALSAVIAIVLVIGEFRRINRDLPGSAAAKRMPQ